jgi:hypothetical protein
MEKKSILDKFHSRASTKVIESFLTLIMILLCSAIIYILYLSAISEGITEFRIIIMLQLFQTIILTALTFAGLKIWEIHEFPKIQKKK